MWGWDGSADLHTSFDGKLSGWRFPVAPTLLVTAARSAPLSLALPALFQGQQRVVHARRCRRSRKSTITVSPLTFAVWYRPSGEVNA
jgi:hypothetical protein